jgi:hypothetical protein
VFVPGVDIIGHRFTRQKLTGDILQKVSVEDAAKRIDMTRHKTHYPAIQGPGVNGPAVSRLYEVIERRAR